jgi:hypothetical protein
MTIISYKKILFVIWLLISFAFILVGGDGHSGGFIYIVYTMFAIPCDFLIMHIIYSLDITCSLICQVLLVFLSGIIQWVFIIGYLMDKFLPKIKIENEEEL